MYTYKQKALKYWKKDKTFIDPTLGQFAYRQQKEPASEGLAMNHKLAALPLDS